MRDWNSGASQVCRGFPSHFHSTYERLKPGLCHYVIPATHWFPLYLWEIETCLFHNSSLFFIIFPLYLWEIETCIRNDPHEPCLSFPLYLWEIETEKLEALAGLEYCYFHSTYERLKRLSWGNNPTNRHISTLPMRDWNLTSSYCIGITSIFPLYLWEIETSPPVFLFAISPSPISTLPMRDWNGKSTICCHQKKQHFHSTYERLKHSLVIDRLLSNLLISTLPMRDWN